MKAKRLGRGLSGLISRTDKSDGDAPASRGGIAEAGGARESVSHLPPSAIQPNPFQPRVAFGVEDLESLKASIQEHGILQPLVVRPSATGHELIAGERRLRAARELGLDEVPVVIRKATDEEMQTLALVENLQRVDLNAMEKARALNAMMRNFALTQAEIAARVGKARTTIANIVRLLDLPDAIQVMVEGGQLTGAQARAILQAEGTERRLRLARAAHTNDWSVREIERRARTGPTIGKRRQVETDPYVRDLEDRLTRALSTQVALRMKKGQRGTIEIAFHGNDELDRLIERLET